MATLQKTPKAALNVSTCDNCSQSWVSIGRIARVSNLNFQDGTGLVSIEANDIEGPTAMDWTRQKDGQLPPSTPTTVWRARPGLASTGSPKEAVQGLDQRPPQTTEYTNGWARSPSIGQGWVALPDNKRSLHEFRIQPKRAHYGCKGPEEDSGPSFANSSAPILPMPPSLRLQDRARKPH